MTLTWYITCMGAVKAKALRFTRVCGCTSGFVVPGRLRVWLASARSHQVFPHTMEIFDWLSNIDSVPSSPWLCSEPWTLKCLNLEGKYFHHTSLPNPWHPATAVTPLSSPICSPGITCLRVSGVGDPLYYSFLSHLIPCILEPVKLRGNQGS